MKRRYLGFIALALSLGLLCGCASILETEIYRRESYAESPSASPAAAAGVVRSYTQLTAAIRAMVEEHLQTDIIQFQGYDGEISADLAAACRELQNEDPLGAYAVDYISYDLRRIVSYYEAELFISFRRSKVQTDGIVELSGTQALRERLTEAMAAGENYLAVYMPATTLTEESLAELVQDCCCQAPGEILRMPAVEIHAYPDSGIARIFELSLDYGLTTEELTARQEELHSAIQEQLETAVDAGGGLWELAVELCGDTALVSEAAAWEDTAYGALVEGRCTSQGLAMAFAAVCQAGGVNAQVVEGQRQGQERWWVLVSLGENRWAHCDLTALILGEGTAFLTGDSAMSGHYTWDTERYPEAEGLGDRSAPVLTLPGTEEAGAGNSSAAPIPNAGSGTDDPVSTPEPGTPSPTPDETDPAETAPPTESPAGETPSGAESPSGEESPAPEESAPTAPSPAAALPAP